jgi:DNA-binding SARP family transcriptional activator
LRSLECYATACLGIGGAELAAAERAASLVVRTAPLRESASMLLMEALARQGNAAEGLIVYESLRMRLRDELGVAPGEAVQAAHRRLLG